MLKFRRAGEIGAIHVFAQVTMVSVLQNRNVRRRMQGKFPAGFIVFLRRFRSGLQHVIGYAADLRFVFNQQRKSVGRIENILGKF